MQATANPRVLIDVVIPRIGVESRANRLALDAAIIVGFALFVAVCAQFSVRLPFTVVPITGQTFGVLLTGGALGSRRGGLSMLVYMVIGMASVPVFAPSSEFLKEKTFHLLFPWSGVSGRVWDLPSGGYIVGFVLAAFLVGLLAERGWVLRSKFPVALIIGNLAVYAVGLPWLAWKLGSDFGQTLEWGLYPFMGGDVVKLLAAALVLPGAWVLVDRLKGSRPRD
jgi:biotin transport system substrate-specific component